MTLLKVAEAGGRRQAQLDLASLVSGPAQPNPIGISAVRLLGVHGTTLEVADVDILDGTPLLDIKPYVPEFDAHPRSRAGWLEGCAEERRVADDRFSETAPDGPGPGADY